VKIFSAFSSNIFFLLLTFSIPATLFAQISGQIKDKETQQPVTGAHILLQQSKNGAITDQKGRFEFTDISLPARITIQAVGYKKRVLTVFEPTKSLFISLVPTSLVVDDVIFSSTRISLTGDEINPINITLVGEEQARTSAASTSADLLKGENGVFIQETSVGQGSVYIRGSAGHKVLYLFNGLRVNPAFLRSAQNQYFGVFDPFAGHEYSVFRGPVSLFYGTDALAGGVDVRPKLPDFTNSTEWNTKATSQLNVGGNDERSLHLSTEYNSEDFAMRLYGTGRHFSAYNMPDGTNEDLWFPYTENLDIANHEYYSIGANFKIRLSERAKISFINSYSVIPNTPRLDRMVLNYGVKEDPQDTSPRYYFYSNTSPLQFQAHHLQLDVVPENLSWIKSYTLKAGYHMLGDNRNSRGFENEPNFPFDYDFQASPTVRTDNNASHLWQTTFDARSMLNSEWILHWGADLSYDYTTSKRFDQNQDTEMTTLKLSRFVSGSDYTMAGLFSSLHWKKDRWTITGGLRYNFIHADIPFEGVHTERGYDPYSQSFDKIIGSANAQFELTKNLSLMSSISTGFRAPNISDLSEVGFRGTDVYQTANPDLNPESTLNIDGGFLWDSDYLNWSMNVFWLHFYDKIDTYSTGRLVNGSGLFLRNDDEIQGTNEFFEYESRNAKELDIYGFESRVEFTPSDKFNTGLTLNYAYGDVKNPDNSTQPVDRIPPLNGELFYEFEFHSDHSVLIQHLFAFEKTKDRLSHDEIEDNRVNPNGTPGFFLTQFNYEWLISDQLEFTAMVGNLFNITYRPHASSLHGMQRNLTVRMAYHF
jgi:outer membrane receptor for ferrienterochelin and colicin